jgi:hypothetical protein
MQTVQFDVTAVTAHQAFFVEHGAAAVLSTPVAVVWLFGDHGPVWMGCDHGLVWMGCVGRAPPALVPVMPRAAWHTWL